VRRWLCGLLLAALPALAAAAAEAPFLWQIEGAKARHYLLGSLHLLPESAGALPPALEQAYAQSQELVFESDIAALSSPELQLRWLLAGKAEKPLKAALPAALHERLAQRAAEVAMPMAMCEPYRPWFCALTLEIYEFQHAGFRPELGLDQQLFQRALGAAKPLHWLEDPGAHLALFSGMSDSESEQFLAATIEQLDETVGSPAELLRIWQSGDAAQLEKLIAEFRERSPAVYERLLLARNRAWLARLQPLLDSDRSQLVVVGAAHLYGPDGLVALLQRGGYRLQAAAVPAAAPAKPEEPAVPAVPAEPEKPAAVPEQSRRRGPVRIGAL